MSAREPFGYARARLMASDLVTRQSAESIDAYVTRLAKATCALLIASITKGTQLHAYLTKLHTYVPAELRAKALRAAAASSLYVYRTPAFSDLKLVPLPAAMGQDEWPMLRSA